MTSPTWPVLTGLRPDVILEICSRVLSFWTHQASMDTPGEIVATKSNRPMAQFEGRFEQQIQNKVTEVTTLKWQISLAKSELAKFKKRYNETAERLLERDRHQQKLQVSFDRLCLRTSIGDEDSCADEEAPAHEAPSPFGSGLGRAI
ncbi:E3 ubiquitin-protein ligase CCNB1IP1 [Lampetra fluviatilis]